MLKSITFKADYRCFTKGQKFDFRPGVNLLVGDQGTGKSSLLQLLQKKDLDVIKITADRIESLSFDFEKDLLRNKGSFARGNDKFRLQMGMMFSSHGECVNAMLSHLSTINKPILIMMDEPDMALSIRSCHKLVELMKRVVSNGSQILAAVHSETIIKSFESVLSLEHGRWMTKAEFIVSQVSVAVS